MPNVFVPMHQPLLSRSKALAPPASWPGTLRAVTSVQLSRARTLPSSLSVSLSLIVIRTIYSFPSRTTFGPKRARVCTCMRACGRARGRAHRGRGPHVRPYGHGDESNRHRSARISPTDRALPPPFPLDSSSSPSARHGNAGLRAFLMLNVAFCLCGCMGDSGERRSPGQRFFQMLNARFVPTHTVCPCYVVSTGLPGTSQRTRQLRGLVTGVTRLGGRRNGEHLDIVECQASCTASTRTGEHPSPFPHPATQFHESLTSILIITNYSLITKQEG